MDVKEYVTRSCGLGYEDAVQRMGRHHVGVAPFVVVLDELDRLEDVDRVAAVTHSPVNPIGVRAADLPGAIPSVGAEASRADECLSCS